MNEALTAILESAEEVWASTDPLASSLGELTDGTVVVVPNSLDRRLWQSYRTEDLEQGLRGDGRLEILYQGTEAHDGDLALVIDVLDQLATDVDFALTVIGVGAALPAWPWLRVLSPGENTVYPRYARWLRGLRENFDIGIAPLTDSPFNQYKSDIKVMEYLALGLIPLASDTGPYVRTGLLDRRMKLDTIDQWHDRLRQLATDQDDRQELSDTAAGSAIAMWGDRSASATGRILTSRITPLRDAQQ